MKFIKRNKNLLSLVCAAVFALLYVQPVYGLETYEETTETPFVPKVSAVSAVLINADTGTVLFEKNAYEKRAVASTTKIMTALLTLEAGDLDRQFTVDGYAIRVEGTAMGLRENDIVTRRALCYGMLLPSGNDAANASAVSVAGNMSEFAKLMNKRAAEIGMTDTNFVNPSGLDANNHYSTAYDMALLTVAALKNPDFKEICSLNSARVEFGNPPELRMLTNNNKLLYMYEGCIGVKTGFTDNARRCLVSAAERDGVTLICVTLNAPNDWADHSSLFDYGFEQVKNNTVYFDSDSLSVKIVGGSRNSVGVEPSYTPEVPLTEEEMKKVEVKPVLVPFLYGGIEKGAFAGNLLIIYDGKVLRSIPLLTSEGVENADETLGFISGVVQFIRKIFV